MSTTPDELEVFADPAEPTSAEEEVAATLHDEAEQDETGVDEFDADAFANRLLEKADEEAGSPPDIAFPAAPGNISLREVGIYISGVYDLHFQTGKNNVVGFDMNQAAENVAVIRVHYRNNKRRYFFAHPLSVVIELEEAAPIVVARTMPNIEVAKR